MARFALFLVLFGSVVGFWTVDGQSLVENDTSEYEGHSSSEIQGDGDISEDFRSSEHFAERLKRDVLNVRNSDFIQSEKKASSDRIIWKDNAETKKFNHTPAVIRVLHHGIYPSLNVSEPAYGSPKGKYRPKRDLRNELNKEIVPLSRQRRIPDYYRSGDNAVGEERGSDGTLKLRPTSVQGEHYSRAEHPSQGDQSFYTNQLWNRQPSYAQGSIRYRTMYKPEDQNYRGDPENKGRVKLISVGYYSVNDSTPYLRSYHNPHPRRGHKTGHGVEHSRSKRDTEGSWWGKLFKSIWPTDARTADDTQESDLPRSEPLILTLEETESNDTAQYGYSSNGNGHSQHIDRIYLVNDLIPTPDTNDPKNDISDKSSTQSSEEITKNDPSSESKSQSSSEPSEESVEPPVDDTVLIQVPRRFVKCQPPKRLARGRCRTVW